MAYAGRMKKDSSTLLTHRATQQYGAVFLAITYFYRAHFLSLALVLHAIVLYHIYAKKRRHHGLGGSALLSHVLKIKESPDCAASINYRLQIG
jgi:hypothetical protein